MAPPFLPHDFAAQRVPDAPLITIVTATLNSAATVQATLDSVAAQEIQDLEHLVVDGGSSDGTLGLVEDAPQRPRVVRQRGRGIYDAFNQGLAEARGELIAFLNSDDVYAHDQVTRIVSQHEALYPEAEIFHADLDVIDASGRTVEAWHFSPGADPEGPEAVQSYLGMNNRRQLPHPTAFVRRRLFRRIGGFDTRYLLAGDYDFFQRAFLSGARLRHLPSVFVRMRLGGASRRRALRAELEALTSSVVTSRRVVGPVADFVQFHLRRAAWRRVHGLLGQAGLD